MDVKNLKVTVIGLGNSGVNAALLLKEHGASVRATDAGDSPELTKTKIDLEAKRIEVETGRHTEGFVKGSDLVVVSPGIESSSQAMKWAARHKIPIIGEMELGYRFCKGKIIAITGTNGKSTVTTLVGEILKAGGKDTVVCGNIGNSLCGEIGGIKDHTWVVLEVSSAQLERIERFKPHVAIILNVTDDHMDRYKNFYEYFNWKLKIFAHQDKNDILILNYDAANLRSLKGLARSRVLFYAKEKATTGGYDITAYTKGTKICSSYGGKEKEIISFNEMKLKGVHNIENVLASSLAAAVAGVGEEAVRKTVAGFKGLEHRFETVDTIEGVEYIDDSKGTTVDSTVRALESCDRPVILIAGGKDKHSDYTLAREIIKKRVKYLIVIGEAKGPIRKAMHGAVETHDAKDMADAVELARKLARKDWIVLLSPMCSSFDMYKNYKERGRIFKEAVVGLTGSRHAVKT